MPEDLQRDSIMKKMYGVFFSGLSRTITNFADFRRHKSVQIEPV